MELAATAPFYVRIELGRRSDLCRCTQTVFKTRVAVIPVQEQIPFIITEVYLSRTAEFMVPVSLEENLGPAAFVSSPESGPADGAADILFIDGYTISHRP